MVEDAATAVAKTKKTKLSATVKPSLKWIYFLFSGVQELTVALGETTQKLVINVSDLLKQVISHFGPRARAIYLNSS